MQCLATDWRLHEIRNTSVCSIKDYLTYDPMGTSSDYAGKAIIPLNRMNLVMGFHFINRYIGTYKVPHVSIIPKYIFQILDDGDL